MKKLLSYPIIIAGSMLATCPAHADYFSDVSYHVMTYTLSSMEIPATVGGTSAWKDNSSIAYHAVASDGHQSYVELDVNGTLLSDGVTWATNNPGVGIQFKFVPGSSVGYTPDESTTAPDYRINLDGTSSVFAGYFHLYYRLVRLLEKVPTGRITSAPQVILSIYNPDGEGPASKSGTILSGIASQPKYTACNINAPTEIKLPTIYLADLKNGAVATMDAPTIKLTNCPGAINGVTYIFNAVYGTHSAANGVLNVVTGDGYAKGIYVQLQNSDGSAHVVNGTIKLDGYNGSGDYNIPDFKVAYYIDNANSTTAGSVKTAIELKVNYN